ncbi:enoyl-CoA hydratase/isomerase family protein [Chloracidobacterium validum]|uniref:Enoyl-CoA hydratase/isomerase family protein n=1 Tax=Chloracidobacterium validum TaxID=2821543 RepID=A0ABX8B853_9BACT|nr:enoyl-CoA hydratase/isomerase family protein [Chloracidobacterium validum]QUW03129.1 enoyl-CoA hydratase/isomerase family protein [Chloracidobacterium validum]
MSELPNAVLYEVAEGIATATLNRPEKRNALDATLLDGLRAAIQSAAQDATARVLVVTGAGKDFCAGADLSALEAMAAQDVMAHLGDAERLVHLFTAMRDCPKPIVARVRGRALAGGCGLASACDLIVADEQAQFGYPEVGIGFVPAMVMAILRRNLGEKRALEWVLTGEIISAQRAQDWGLVNRVLPSDTFDERFQAYVAQLAARSSSALHLTKRLLYHMDGLSFEAALRSGADINVLARHTADCRAGIARFLSKA